jgi:hypothetical protein
MGQKEQQAVVVTRLLNHSAGPLYYKADIDVHAFWLGADALPFRIFTHLGAGARYFP